MDEFTKRRLRHNEQLFRAVNDEVREVRADQDGPRIAFVCECADRDCRERLEASDAEYRAIRAGENRYLVVPGHVVPEIERVVETTSRYTVVEKDAA
jgi:hypothetical protein